VTINGLSSEKYTLTLQNKSMTSTIKALQTDLRNHSTLNSGPSPPKFDIKLNPFATTNTNPQKILPIDSVFSGFSNHKHIEE